MAGYANRTDERTDGRTYGAVVDGIAQSRVTIIYLPARPEG